MHTSLRILELAPATSMDRYHACRVPTVARQTEEPEFERKLACPCAGISPIYRTGLWPLAGWNQVSRETCILHTNYILR